MITGTVWGITLLIAGFIATIAATQVLFAALFARRMAATRLALRERPIVSTLGGIPAFLIPLGISIAVAQKFQFPGAIGISAISLIAIFGLGAVALEVGVRLPSEGPAANGWRAMIRGSVVVSLASLLPVAGWFLVWPLTVLAGTGAWAITTRVGARMLSVFDWMLRHSLVFRRFAAKPVGTLQGAAQPRDFESVPDLVAAAEPAEVTA